MPEGDTIFLAAHRLNVALGGRALRRSDFRVPRFATLDLSGRMVNDVVARGKHLLFHIGDVTAHTHQDMHGEWKLQRAHERPSGRAHEIRIVFENDEWRAIGLRIPVIDVMTARDEDQALAHLGPDLLGPDWDPVEALRRMTAAPGRALGDVLLDQRVVAGLGNVYKSEICFLRGVHPRTPVDEVDDLSAVLDLAKRLMNANRFTGAHITTGDRRPRQRQWVYGRAAEPCRRCGTPIASERDDAGRITYWCPHCQR